MINESSDFRLLPYLKADLCRARILLYGTSVSQSGLRLWLGIFSPRFLPVLICRLAYFFYSLNIGYIAKVFSSLNFFLFGIEIAVKCHIGKGLFLPHTQGTVIGAISIGENAIIFQGVTLGSREIDYSYQDSSRPIVGDNVIIGSGAKVLGGLTLGSGSRVGANAVVLNDVGPGLLAIGVPAKVIDKSFL
jgi:serine O-acetyltransferase